MILPLPVCLDAVGLHVDILLDFTRQVVRLAVNQPPQVPGKDIEFFEFDVGKTDNLSQKSIKPDVVSQLTAEVVFFLGRHLGESRRHRGQNGIKLVLGRLPVEIDPGEPLDVRLV